MTSPLPTIPTVFITLGDPLSINLWALSKLLPRGREPGIAYVLLGDERAFNLGATAQLKQETYLISSLAAVTADELYFLPTTRGASANLAAGEWERSLSGKERGQIATAALNYLGTIDWQTPAKGERPRAAVVTCPIDKHAANLAGFGFPGQTEFFEQLWGKPGIMVLAGHKLRVGLATNHLALADVPRNLSVAGIVAKGRALADTLTSVLAADTGSQLAPIAVCGLNPHCGDGGLFGTEDQTIVAEAVNRLNQQMPGQFVGPLPADTVFFNAYEGRYSGVLAMYHDQGLAPLKTVHFYDAINITGGLDYLRVSPDHGPAADLFGKSQGNTDSFALALRTAARAVGVP